MVVASCSAEGKLCCYPLLRYFTQMFANGAAKLKTFRSLELMWLTASAV